MSAAAINPILVPLAQQFNITTLTASYHFALFLFFEGIGALLALPLSNVYGRRPVYLVGNALAGAMNVTAAYWTMNWTAVMVTRAANGLGVGATISIGVATLNDMYFTHERPFYIGMYSLFASNGMFLGHLIGGYVAEKSGWVQNCFSIPVSGCTS
jgi:MFS family permease